MAEGPDDWLRWATEEMERSNGSNYVEQKARAAAIWLGRDEEEWETLIPLLIAIETGRKKAIWMERQTEEYQQGFANYLMNR